MNINQYYGAIIGSACADTLGRATEFMNERDIQKFYDGKVTDFQPDRLRVFDYGEYTDDTYLMLCIANSLIDSEGFDEYDMSDKFAYWYRTNGRDCGNLTSDAMSLICDGFEPYDAGKHAWEMSGKQAASNGGLMRNTAVPLFYANNFSQMVKVSENACKITHYDLRCRLSCIAHSIAMYAILHDKDIFDTVWAYCGEKDNEFDDILYEARDCTIDEFTLSGYGQGYTYLSLKTALSAVFNYDNFEEPIIEIVNKGGDTDTNACIAGGLLGAKYGIDAVPERWQKDLLGYSDLYNIAEKLYELSQKQ
ncbi:MAG: ADP-ribosylglycohydrolase family protein [Armatimonadetes bacterium]|nr:ADP-ribosylglycohydrolase family protein [Candidatus Hippobium faecium]